MIHHPQQVLFTAIVTMQCFSEIGTAQIQNIWNNVDFQVLVDLCATEWNVPMKHKSCMDFSSFEHRHNKRKQTDNLEKCLQNYLRLIFGWNIPLNKENGRGCERCWKGVNKISPCGHEMQYKYRWSSHNTLFHQWDLFVQASHYNYLSIVFKCEDLEGIWLDLTAVKSSSISPLTRPSV